MGRTALDQLKRSWWFAWAAAIVLALSQVNDAADGMNRLLVLARLRPDALATPFPSAGEFTRTFSEVAWDRLFWSRAFIARTELGAPKSEVDDAWHAYISSSEVWSKEFMVFLVSARAYYGKQRDQELEGSVQNAILTMADAVVKVRYSPSPNAQQIQTAKAAIDDANFKLYHFVRDENIKRKFAN